jgi:subtilisin-like proprotein convertase family protein
MFLRNRFALSASILAVALAPLFAQSPSGSAATDVKAELHARMSELAQQIDALRSQGAAASLIAPLTEEYTKISLTLGGDEPVARPHRGLRPVTAVPLTSFLAPPTCGGATTTTNFPGSNGPIAPPVPFTGTTFTLNVAGAGPYLWDVNLNMALQHTFNADMDITLQSPSGTIVTITTDNAGANDDVFNGTTFDDNANDPVTDHVFANLVVAPLLSPEGRLAAFRGENPNGTWTLRCFDDLGADVGTLNSWSLDISTLGSAPVETTTSFSSTPGLAIPDLTTVTDTIPISGIGTYLDKVVLTLAITHTECQDLDITLTSPGGTVVAVSTDNGGALDNVFNGTTFDPDAPITVTDNVYVNLTTAVLLSPEGSFDNFLGQDPTGNWTLTVTDDLATDTGTLVSWGLAVTTTTAPSVTGPSNFPGVGGPIADNAAATPVNTVFTASVSGVGTTLWDVDLSTFIAITSSADIDMTLTSPSGTVVVITTDNGGVNDNCFNGTLWDDNVNVPCVDFVYANNVVATPLSPEGRLSAFRGENPNGTWTLTVMDDAPADNGTLTSWALDLTTLAAPYAEASTTLTSNPGTAIATTAPPQILTDVIAAAGLGASITEVEVAINITHTFAADLDITLTSPSGTVVVLTTDNGGGNDNVFTGTLFDSDAPVPVTDQVFVNLVNVPLVAPEGSFDNFVGQNPNGNWTLTVSDDASGDGGTWVSWGLTIRTCSGPAGVGFCFGDGSGTACPCANNGAAGNGCANSIDANGANLGVSGIASVASDTLVLLGTGMPNSSALYFQGTSQAAAGAGTVFGDGKRCAAGSVIRLATKSNTGGGSQYPAVGDLPVSVKGLVPVAGGTRDYQVWYRNAAAFCTASTFNLSNGLEVVWTP